MEREIRCPKSNKLFCKIVTVAGKEYVECKIGKVLERIPKSYVLAQLKGNEK